MIVYRITRRKYADLTGAGGLRASGRCHRKGTPVIYAAQNVSLALAETLVHLDLSEMPLDYVLMTIEVPDSVPVKRGTVAEVLAASTSPEVPVFLVPSAVVPQELNVVMYPHAAGFRAQVTKVEPFHVDERLLGLKKG